MGRRGKPYDRKDDRTDEERGALRFLVVGVDTFMSGWGGASRGLSVAAWACRDEDTARVMKWVKERGDIKKVRLYEENPYTLFPARQVFPGVVHFHIYAVNPKHPALAA